MSRASAIQQAYFDQMVRAVTGAAPSMLHPPADRAALVRIAEHLTMTEEATALLRARGYGQAGMTLLDVVKVLPDISRKA